MILVGVFGILDIVGEMVIKCLLILVLFLIYWFVILLLIKFVRN